MKQILSIIPIIILIILTTFTKNSTKKLDKEIFDIKENLRLLSKKYELVLLDYNYLSSPSRLLEYQKNFFENELKPIDIKNISKIEFKDQEILTNGLIDKYLINNEKKK
jgi:hypothetical protein|tara:strand:- start:22 stop:348 length:327 start_codon:yes stop_codon:yes gene_type:complete